MYESGKLTDLCQGTTTSVGTNCTGSLSSADPAIWPQIRKKTKVWEECQSLIRNFSWRCKCKRSMILIFWHVYSSWKRIGNERGDEIPQISFQVLVQRHWNGYVWSKMNFPDNSRVLWTSSTVAQFRWRVDSADACLETGVYRARSGIFQYNY